MPRRSSRTPRPSRSLLLRRLSVTLAAGTLALAASTVPATALASDTPGDDDQSSWNQQGDDAWDQQTGGGDGDGQGDWDQQTGGGDGQGDWDQQTGGGDGQGDDNDWDGQTNGGGDGGGGEGDWNQQTGGGQGGGNRGNRGEYRGVVTTGSLALRTSPERGSKIIRYAHRGDVVPIHCKVGGDNTQGNPLWYLLTDDTWAWGSARHIDNIGPAPRWC